MRRSRVKSTCAWQENTQHMTFRRIDASATNPTKRHARHSRGVRKLEGGGKKCKCSRRCLCEASRIIWPAHRNDFWLLKTKQEGTESRTSAEGEQACVCSLFFTTDSRAPLFRSHWGHDGHLSSRPVEQQRRPLGGATIGENKKS